MLKNLRAFGALFAAVALVAACAAPTEEESDGELTGETEDALKSVKLKYEGTCEFLRNCSTPSRNAEPGTVNWGCGGWGVCEDNAKWVAGPNRSYCGKTVKFCTKKGLCTTATVKDVSVSRDWEGSNGVFDALDLDHGLLSRCGGYGQGNVTVAVQ